MRQKKEKVTREELVQLARVAQVFEEDIVQDFFDINEEKLWKRWIASGDIDEREEIHKLMCGVTAFRKFLEEVKVKGKMAAQDIEEQTNAMLKRTNR